MLKIRAGKGSRVRTCDDLNSDLYKQENVTVLHHFSRNKLSYDFDIMSS